MVKIGPKSLGDALEDICKDKECNLRISCWLLRLKLFRAVVWRRAVFCDGLLVYERFLRTHLLPPWQIKILLLYPTFRCITHKKVSKPAKEIPNKEISLDPIRVFALL